MIAGFVIAGFVFTYFTVILPGFHIHVVRYVSIKSKLKHLPPPPGKPPGI